MGEVLYRIRLREVTDRLGDAGWSVYLSYPFAFRGGSLRDQTAVLIEHELTGREERDWGDVVMALERLAQRVLS